MKPSTVHGSVVLVLSWPGAAVAAASVQVAPVAPSDSPAAIVSKAAEVVPSPRQLAWLGLPRRRQPATEPAQLTSPFRRNRWT